MAVCILPVLCRSKVETTVDLTQYADDVLWRWLAVYNKYPTETTVAATLRRVVS